jgi:hypothetical protein
MEVAATSHTLDGYLYVLELSVCAGVICMCWSYRVLPAFLGVVRVAN